MSEHTDRTVADLSAAISKAYMLGASEAEILASLCHVLANTICASAPDAVFRASMLNAALKQIGEMASHPSHP